MSFNKGDVVKLMSGSPQLTVLWVYEDEHRGTMVRCKWWDDKKKLYPEDDFPISSIKKVGPIIQGVI